jgi:hypothetical protein
VSGYARVMLSRRKKVRTGDLCRFVIRKVGRDFLKECAIVRSNDLWSDRVIRKMY